MFEKQNGFDFKGLRSTQGVEKSTDNQLRHLRELDLKNIEKPKTLIILHYNGKRITVPLFNEVTNIAQLLYQHIHKLQQAILKNELSWQKKSNSKIVCFQIKKQQKQPQNAQKQKINYSGLKQTDGDLRSDIMLSLFRIQANKQNQDFLEELNLKMDITKIYKYLQIEPYYHFFLEESFHIDHPMSKKSEIQIQNNNISYFEFYRILNTSLLFNTYLTRKVTNGYFYCIKVYSHKSLCGIKEFRNLQMIHHINEIRNDNLKPSLLSLSHQVVLIPNPEMEESEYQDSEQNCKHIAIIYPYFVKGSLEQYLRDAKYNKVSKKINQLDCLNYLKELMWGVHILHEKYNLIHRALSPSNILIDQNHQLKIVNYSSCTYCYDENGKIIEYSDLKYLNRGYETGRKEIQDFFESSQMIQYDLGEFTAPEIKKKENYNFLIDFYSIGVIVKKLYESCQGYEKIPISQNNENSMLAMINKLTSVDLNERMKIVNELIEQIERQNYQDKSEYKTENKINNMKLEQIKIGKTIEIEETKKFIENTNINNDIDHKIILNYFKKRNIKKAVKSKNSLMMKTVNKKLSKEKGSTKNSREKSAKCLSKNSHDSNQNQNSLIKNRKYSKNSSNKNGTNNSFNSKKDQSGSQSKQFKQIVKPENSEIKKNKRQINETDSPHSKKVSKSKSHQKKKKDETYTMKLYTHQHQEKDSKIFKQHKFDLGIPKSPKINVRMKSPNKQKLK